MSGIWKDGNMERERERERERETQTDRDKGTERDCQRDRGEIVKID